MNLKVGLITCPVSKIVVGLPLVPVNSQAMGPWSDLTYYVYVFSMEQILNPIIKQVATL